MVVLGGKAHDAASARALLLDRTAQLRALAQSAVPMVPKLVEQQKNRFLDRWKEALALGASTVLPEIAQDRALTEATAFAIRIDVAEEITRLSSHLDEIERLKADGVCIIYISHRLEELKRVADRIAVLRSPAATMAAEAVVTQVKQVIEPIKERNPDVFDHLAQAGSELLELSRGVCAVDLRDDPLSGVCGGLVALGAESGDGVGVGHG